VKAKAAELQAQKSNVAQMNMSDSVSALSGADDQPLMVAEKKTSYGEDE